MKRQPQPVNATEEKEKFQLFLFEMDDVLESFVADAIGQGIHLDYSIDSLDHLERYLLGQLTVPNHGQLQNRAARYLGEVFRKRFGGKWELCLKDPKYLFFKLPVVTGFSAMQVEFCPIEVIGNFLARKELGLLRGAVESHRELVR